MLRVLRMAADLGIEALGLADPDEPDRREPGAPGGRHVHELGALRSTSPSAGRPPGSSHEPR